MKQKYILLFLIFLVHISWAQNSFLRDNEITVNPYSISPSYSGFNSNHEIFANYLNHFSGLKGAPNSAWVNYNGLVKGNFGIGASVRYEKFGAFRNIRGDITSAYHLKIATDHRLSIGIGISISQTSLDFSNSNADPMNDLALSSVETKNGIGLNAALGFTYAWKKFNITVSAPSIIPMKKIGNLFLYSQPIHFRGHASYDIDINRLWSVKPQVLVDYVLNAPINYNGIVSVKYHNLLWLNLGYGAQSIVSAGLGTLIAERFTLQYTFKYGMNGIAKSIYGNHEICVGFVVGKIKSTHINNSIFSKKSKSPYHDWE